jgi:hypothetical protein
VDGRHLKGVIVRQWRQQARQTLDQQCLSHARWTNHRQVMSTSSCHFNGPSGKQVTTHVRKIQCGGGADSLPIIVMGGRVRTIHGVVAITGNRFIVDDPALEDGADVMKRVRADDGDSTDRFELSRPAGRHDDSFQTGLSCRKNGRQHPA